MKMRRQIEKKEKNKENRAKVESKGDMGTSIW